MTTLAQKTQEAAQEHSYGNLLYASHHAGFIAGAQWERDREKWIKVEDVPPEHMKKVQCIRNGEMEYLFYHAHFHIFILTMESVQPVRLVTHWQPMPQPPKS